MNIPFVDLKAQYQSIKNEMDTAITNVINETAFIGGKYVKQFEQNFAELYGIKHCISCANGTDSLYIIMKMLGIGAGDEVITVANSWISSSETITQTGAKPVFVDIHANFYSIDETKLEAAISTRTKAVILVHLQGQICDTETIKAICDKNSIALIEDCAQSHFSEQNGKRAGTIGIAGSFSFYPGKNLGAYGDAGCIITNDDSFSEKCRMYANHGALKKHHHTIEGINSRLDGIQAAVLNTKLPYILQWTKQRIDNARKYDEALQDIKQIIIPKVRPNSKHSYHLYVIQCERREDLMQHLKNNGIETAIHYPTILPSLPCYEHLGAEPSDFPIANAMQSKILSLPLYPELTDLQITYVAETIKQFYSKA
jgi:dTDP-4-amino-4,6-dideoxygalactose transaminase